VCCSKRVVSYALGTAIMVYVGAELAKQLCLVLHGGCDLLSLWRD
jgi:hypothetical protein